MPVCAAPLMLAKDVFAFCTCPAASRNAPPVTSTAPPMTTMGPMASLTGPGRPVISSVNFVRIGSISLPICTFAPSTAAESSRCATMFFFTASTLSWLRTRPILSASLASSWMPSFPLSRKGSRLAPERPNRSSAAAVDSVPGPIFLNLSATFPSTSDMLRSLPSLVFASTPSFVSLSGEFAIVLESLPMPTARSSTPTPEILAA